MNRPHLNILIVDDNPLNRKLLRATLEAEQYTVIEAPDGLEALQTLNEARVDAIISDILMPKMDGYRLCSSVRGSASHATLPFIFLTATYTSPGDEKLAYELGADKYMRKGGGLKDTLMALHEVTSDPRYREPRDVRCAAEMDVIKEYNEALVEKLEKKNFDLEVAKEQLLGVQQRMRHVLYASPAIVYSLDITGGTFLPSWVSENIERTMGVRLEQIRREGWWFERIHPEDRALTEAHQKTILENGHTLCEYRILTRDGHYAWVQDRQVLVMDATGAPLEVVGSWTDITERKEMEVALKAGEERYRSLVERMNEGLITIDGGGLLTFANRKVSDMLGYTPADLDGKLLHDIVGAAYLLVLDEQFTAWKNGSAEPFECMLQGRNGRKPRVLISPKPLLDEGGKFAGAIAVIADLSEIRDLEDRLRQSQKMESLGTLVGGITHDFGNILGLIMGHVSLMQRSAGDPAKITRGIETIAGAAKRGNALIRQLLMFVRKSEPVQEPVEVNHLIREMVTLMEETFPKGIAVSTRLSEGLPPVIADMNQLHQVLLNLCVNARDAMPEKGALDLATGMEEGAAVRKKWPQAAAASYVAIEVSDSGMGMDEATRSRIFEPFYTTKERGSGTGLGLSTVYGIVESHRGFIDVRSEPGVGTSFVVYLPAAEQSNAQPAPTAGAPADPAGT